MARFSYIPNRVIDANGISDGASIYFYEEGTTTPITVYSDEGLTTPVSNPYVVAAGAAVPPLYYSGDAPRVRVEDDSGNVISDDDPYIPLAGASDLSASGGSNEVGFIQSGANADAETVQDALRREVWADQYKLAADTDDSACITRAVTALLAAGGGGVVRLSRRTYTLNSGISFSELNNVRIIGAGNNSSGTIIRENYLTGDGITFSNCQGCEISEVNFWPAVRKTDGYAVTLDTGSFDCSVDIRCDYGWNGLNINGATETRYKIHTRKMLGAVGVNFSGTATYKSYRAVCIDQLSDNPFPSTTAAEASNAKTFSSGMTLADGDHFVANGAIWQCTSGGTAAASAPSGYPTGTTPESVFSGTVTSGTATLKWVANANLAHIVHDNYAYSLVIDRAALLNGAFGLRQLDTAATGTSYPVWIFANDLECDHNYLVGIDLERGEGFYDSGTVWVGSCLSGNGIEISANYRGNVSLGSGSRIMGNAQHGILRDAGPVDVRINGTEVCDNSVSSSATYHGIEIAASAVDTQIIGARFGDSVSVSGNNQGYGIFINNGTDKTTIIGTNVRGNTTGAISVGTGQTDLIIRDCPGYSAGGNEGEWTEYTVATAGDAFINIPLDSDGGTRYHFILDNYNSGVNQTLQLRLSDDNGATFKSGATDYWSQSDTTGAAQIELQAKNNGENTMAEFKIVQMNTASGRPRLEGQFMGSTTGAARFGSDCHGGLASLAAGDYNAIQIRTNTSNLNGCTVLVKRLT